MAGEQEKEGGKGVLRYVNGLFKDTALIDQIIGSLQFSRNLVMNRVRGALSNEGGVTIQENLPLGSIVLGALSLTDESIVLFLKIGSRSEIGIYKEGVYTTLFNPDPSLTTDTDMKFSEDFPITAKFKKQADGDVIIYWLDDNVPPRALNITRQQSSLQTHLYGRDPNLSPDKSFINKLNLFPHSGPVPHVELYRVENGGNVRTGIFYLCLGYTDKDLTSTNFVTIANPISIVDDPENIRPIESYDGARPDLSAGKVISWTISNLNTDYEYLSVAVVTVYGGVDKAVRLNDVAIEGNSTIKIAFTGTEGTKEYSTEQVVIDAPMYDTAKTMEQVDNTLYLGHLTGNLDVGYQKHANYIKLDPVQKVFSRFDPFTPSNINLDEKKGYSSNRREDGYRDMENIFKNKGYTRDEVYALYIAFILRDGRMSYAYHIPGREAVENISISDITEQVLSDPTIQIPTTLDEDTFISDYTNQQSHIKNISGEQAKFYQWFDVSMANNVGIRNMNFWKNLNEFYPDTDDWDVVNAASPSSIYPSLRSDHVRHHRFPGNSNQEFTTIKSSNAEEVQALETEKKGVVHWYWFGGLEAAGLRVEGAHETENAQDAVEWQEENYNNPGGGMGGNDPDGTPAHGTPFDGNQGTTNNPISPPEVHRNSCHPEWNQVLHDQILGTNHSGHGHWQPEDEGGLWDCGIDSMDDVTFNYTRNIPNVFGGMRVVVGFDPPNGLNCIPQGFTNDPPSGSSGHCSWVFRARTGGISGYTVQLGQRRDLTCHIPTGNRPIYQSWKPRPGWIAWMECESIVDQTVEVEHKVSALGFKLSDIIVPKTIADQVQGFRIYHADRKHEHRTVLGQNPLHSMAQKRNMDPSGCNGGGISQGRIDYIISPGQPHRTKFEHPDHEWSFHDFYLLNNTPGLANATHIRTLYEVGMFSWKGPVTYYKDAKSNNPDAEDEEDQYSCLRPQVITSFHMAGNFKLTQKKKNWVLTDRAKVYVHGNTIYEGATDGFGKTIYNIGGETMIALGARRNLPYLPCGEQLADAPWRELRSDNSKPSYTGYSEDADDRDGELMLHHANLQAYKTDVYGPLDTQDLVWTGYEVVGDDFDRFTVNENGVPLQPGSRTNFETDEIYGGDTFICRHGYRMTHREEVNDDGGFPNNAAIDHKSVIFTIVESTENINFRHVEDPKSVYFPGSPLSVVLRQEANTDLTYNPDDETGNIKYNEDYGAVNNIKQVLPLPYQLVEANDFSTLVIRSAKATALSLVDNYRVFVADQMRSLNNDRGALWKLVAFDNQLLFHMEDALFKTVGKQRMKTSDGGEAFVGQGDLFKQEPDMIRHTDGGYMGTRAQYAGAVTPFGYFFVDNSNNRIFLLGERPIDLTSRTYGMEGWFKINLPPLLSIYNITNTIDNPIKYMGLHATWDERYNRVILTKKDLRPTNDFLDAIQEPGSTELTPDAIRIDDGVLYIYTIPEGESGSSSQYEWVELPLEPGRYFEETGWTISFCFFGVPGQKIGVWESFHDYVPYIYTHSKVDVFSFVRGVSPAIDRGIYKHNDDANMSIFYGTRYPFEVGVVHNLGTSISKQYSSVELLSDTLTYDTVLKTHHKDLHAGFTSAIIYNTDANSGLMDLEYMINIRKTGNSWKINQFRDLSKEVSNTDPYYVGPHTGGNYNVPGLSVTGQTTSQVTMQQDMGMFLVDGMYEPLNNAYIDLTKPWYKKGKFVDRFLGIRLISDNTSNKLINLYSVSATFKPQER